MSSQKKRLSSQDLKAQKQQAESKLDELRQQQVEALEEGREFEHNSEILLVSERIDALTKAVERADKREQQAREQEIIDLERKRLIQIRDKALSLQEKRVEALADAEVAMASVVESLKRFLGASDDIAATMVKATPILERHNVQFSEIQDFSQPNVHARAGSYLSSALADLLPLYNSLDQLVWQSSPPRHSSWSDGETRAVSSSLSGVFVKSINRVVERLAEKPDEKAEQYLSFPDFCERFSITRRTLYRWMTDEDFPTPVVINKRRCFKLSDIEKWELQRSGVDTDLPADIDGLPVVSKVITDYNQFADALRKRREAMKITCAELDMLAGMQEGYSNKLENHHRPGFGRGVGKDTFPL